MRLLKAGKQFAKIKRYELKATFNYYEKEHFITYNGVCFVQMNNHRIGVERNVTFTLFPLLSSAGVLLE